MDIEEEIQKIIERNKRVEGDKAWETSWVRRFTIAVLTYVIAGFWLRKISVPDPWLNAFVSTGGYILSTLSLSVVRSLWLRRRQ